MIFVTVGTQKFQFNRLLKEIDILIANNQIIDKVICQSGYSTYIPKNYSIQRFMNGNEYEENIKKCNLLITHAGVGTILTGKKYNKQIIVVPRLSKYNEHIDDHQLQIAEGFADKQLVFECKDISKLKNIIQGSHKELVQYDFNNRKFLNAFKKILY
ncbi:PssE/Cps14G family polysaccharide biosynthesis glycosyltransferase [Lactobacillus sp. LL6]|uniref:PssE/Cps14G family polysaccharide biosynthesis glycosyltransferase n=1 Tax=Lactobacillus sp. LL6 TaxID=2596827 RepID=UPI0011847028|nr:PssE/Cps14G family polysaccharide biosynthesis glycosyltransferase [Lactobacillus sp. LL6]TSO25675.1 beta(1,3)galactosyltransferase EpsH [Lactobacillus sp. LL6]